jgi:hypothetical protein
MRTQRHASGSVRYDRRRKTWNYLWYDGPTRRSKRIGTKQEFPTKAAAWKAVDRLEIQGKPQQGEKGDTVRSVIMRYEAERMPSRQSTGLSLFPQQSHRAEVGRHGNSGHTASAR